MRNPNQTSPTSSEYAEHRLQRSNALCVTTLLSPSFTETSAKAVKTAEAAVATATEPAAVERARGGCKDLCRQREAEERAAREALLKVQQNHAATVKAADLDGKIAAAEHALSQVDIKAATMEADPQSASMAEAIGADQNLIAALSHAVFAISIELGSGVGFWLVFGHGAPGRRRLECEPAASAGLIDRAGAIDLQAVEATPAEIIERFFLEAARRRIGPRVQSVAVWSAYKVWCAQRGYSAVSHAMFGRLVRWPKHRAGGTVWYLDCELAVGYGGPPPESGPKALPAPARSSMACRPRTRLCRSFVFRAHCQSARCFARYPPVRPAEMALICEAWRCPTANGISIGFAGNDGWRNASLPSRVDLQSDVLRGNRAAPKTEIARYLVAST